MNRDLKTIDGFGEEWEKFDQTALTPEEHQELFEKYFYIFPWNALPVDATGFDMGCGSGRWAKLVAPRVGKLYCVDPASKALNVAKKALSNQSNVSFLLSGVDDCPIDLNSMDFGYSLGVLHHIPDTLNGIKSCASKLKPGAPFLLYLYYALDGRPFLFRCVFKLSDFIRKGVSRLPQSLKTKVCQAIAGAIYYPLAHFSKGLESLGVNVKNIPLSFYRDKSFYVMQTDALDRFGTPLEQRFTRNEIKNMMEEAGFENIVFSEREPFWCAVGVKK